MTDTPSTTTTDTPPTTRPDPLTLARTHFADFMAERDPTFDDDHPYIARTAALVSIAESLDVIAGALRPGYRVDVDDLAGNESGATPAATVVTPESPTQPRL